MRLINPPSHKDFAGRKKISSFEQKVQKLTKVNSVELRRGQAGWP